MEDIDKLLRNKIGNLESAVPNDMWDKIEAELDVTNDGYRLIPVLIWGGIAFLLAFGAYYFILINQASKSTIATLEKHIEIDETLAENDIIDHKAQTYNISNATQPATHLSDNSTNTQKEQTSELESSNSLIKLDNIGSNATLTNKSTFTNSTSYNNLNSKNLNSKDEFDTKNTYSLEYSMESEASGLDKGNSEFVNINESDRSEASFVSDVTLFNPTSISLTDIVTKDRSIGLVNLINGKYLSSISSEEETINMELDRDPDCPELIDHYSEHFFLEAHLSPIYNHYNYSAVNKEYEDYAIDRSLSESDVLSFNFGVRIGFQGNDGYGISTGLEFTYLNTKFNHIDTFSMIKSTRYDTLYENGEVVDITTVSETTYGTNSVQSYSYQTMLDIPLLVSYNQKISDRVSFNIAGGVFLNLNFSHEGHVLHTNDKPIFLSSSIEDDYDVFKESLGVSFYLATGLNFRIKRNWRLLFMPNVKYYSESFTLGNYPLKENHILFGMRTGVRYQF